MIFKEMNLDKSDRLPLLAVSVFSIILAVHYILFNVDLGVYCSDVYTYLLNALYFTGTNIGATGTIHLSPIICFLTSLLFEIGLVDRVAIYIVTGSFAVIGNIGLYILFKNRFDRIYALTGTVLFSTFSINLLWLANGSLDIPAVGLTIWAVLFAIIAIDKNPKFHILLFPVLIIGIFTRYTVGLIVPVLLLYYLLKKGFGIDKKEFRYIITGIIISAAICAVILASIMVMNNSSLPFLNQASEGIAGNIGSVQDLAYNTNDAFYIENFLNFISSSHTVFDERTPVLENPTVLSAIPLLIIAIGILISLKDCFRKALENKKILAGVVILAVLASVSFNHVTSVVTIIITLLCLLLAGRLTERHKELMMLGWILTYLIFFSYIDIKVDRYVIPVIAPLIYLILFYLSKIQLRLNINKNIIPLILIVLFVGQGFAFTSTVDDGGKFESPQLMADYVISDVDDYENHSIGVYNLRAYSWYLAKYLGAIDSSQPSMIDRSEMDYYISDIQQDNLTNYTEIKNIGNLYLYEKISN